MWKPEHPVRHAVPEARWPSAGEASRSRLFSPVSLRGARTLAQRTWVPAMVPWRAAESGEVTEAVVAWYRRFAAGQPGALVAEATGIRDVPSGALLRIGDDRFIPGLTRLVEAVREASGGRTRFFIQLIDFLALRRRPTPQAYFTRYLALTPAHRERLAAHTGEPRWRSAQPNDVRAWLSTAGDAAQAAVLTPRELEALRFGYRERVTDTHLPHIQALPSTLPALFAAAAARALKAGFDGVELHFAHAYTMASFLSATNTRTDGYGGDLAGRLRLPLEVVAAVRERVGTGGAVGCRMLGDEAIAGGTTIAEAAQIGVALAEAGLDFLSVSAGGKFDDARQPRIGEAVYPYTGRSGYECMPTVISDARGPFSRNVPLAAAIRRAVLAAGFADLPVVAAGGINAFDQAEGILARGEADIIAAARQSLADPDWFLKLRLGRGAEIRRCKYTNYCEALDQRHRPVTCQLWDRQGVDAPGVSLAPDGRRRLIAPPWASEPE